jgi:hypothetical protein
LFQLLKSTISGNTDSEILSPETLQPSFTQTIPIRSKIIRLSTSISASSVCEEKQTGEAVGDSISSENVLKVQITNNYQQKSSYDAETEFLKFPLGRDERRSSRLCVKPDTAEAEEANAMISEDFFEYEVDSSICRNLLGSQYSESYRVLPDNESLRMYRQLMGYDQESEVKASSGKTWFDLAREYKAAHPDEDDAGATKDIPAPTSEFLGPDGQYEGQFPEDSASSFCSSVTFTLVERENPNFPDSARRLSRSSSTCYQPTSKQVEDMAERNPRLKVGDDKPGRFHLISCGFGRDPVADKAASMQWLQLTLYTDSEVNHAKSSVSDDDDQPGSDQRAFSISVIPPGFKLSRFAEQSNLEEGSEDSTLSEVPGEEMASEFELPPAWISFNSFELATDPKGKTPLKHPFLPPACISPLGIVNSTEDQKGNTPSKPEFTPIYDVLEPFQKSQSSEGLSTAITLDDLNIRLVDKVARVRQGDLVDVLQAQGLMPQRLRPELTRVQPTSRQHRASGEPEPSPASLFGPAGISKGLSGTDCVACTDCSRLSDAETVVSSTFGEEVGEREVSRN